MSRANELHRFALARQILVADRFRTEADKGAAAGSCRNGRRLPDSPDAFGQLIWPSRCLDSVPVLGESDQPPAIPPPGRGCGVALQEFGMGPLIRPHRPPCSAEAQQEPAEVGFRGDAAELGSGGIVVRRRIRDNGGAFLDAQSRRRVWPSKPEKQRFPRVKRSRPKWLARSNQDLRVFDTCDGPPPLPHHG